MIPGAALRSRINGSAVWHAAILVPLSIGLGVAIPREPQAAVAFLGVLLAVPLLLLPPVQLLMGAVFLALVGPTFVTIGVLPSIVTFFDIPLVWLAATATLLQGKPDDSRSRMSKLLLILALLVTLSWVLNPSEILRPLLYMGLIGEPFAALYVFERAQPTDVDKRRLKWLLTALLLVQLPFGLGQIVSSGFGDPVEGTLWGAGNGTRTMAAIAAIGGFWFILRGLRADESYRIYMLLAGACLLLWPLAADVRQIIFALPFGLLAARSGHRQFGSVVIAGALSAAMAWFLFYGPPGTLVRKYVDDARTGEGGKFASAEVVFEEGGDDNIELLFGLGPAESVSRTAFLTTPLFQEEDSPLTALGLHQSDVAVRADLAAKVDYAGSEGGSFHGGLSSFLGVFGDLGIAGLAVYLWMIGTTVFRLRKLRSPAGAAATAGWVIATLYAVTFDGWEQPPLMLFIAILSALAFSEAQGKKASAQLRNHVHPGY